MKRSHLLGAALALTTLAAGACTRAETERQANETAADVRAVAAEAGDRLADGWLTTRVQARYFADDEIKARYIDVSTRDGVVTVAGYVDSDAARQRALRLARETDGVKAVTDRLRIGQAPDGESQPVATTGETAPSPADRTPLDDARITSTIQAKYFLDSTVKGRRIDVDTRNGIVTLRGVVSSETERSQALTLARSASGVVRVEDALMVDPSLDVSAASR